MATYSGKYGQVLVGASEFAEANRWTMDDGVDAAQYGKFGGAGFKVGSVGQRAATGTIEGKWDSALPPTGPLRPGASVTLKLYIQSVASGGALDIYYQVPAQITRLSVGTDAESNLPVAWTATWQSNGQIIEPII